MADSPRFTGEMAVFEITEISFIPAGATRAIWTPTFLQKWKGSLPEGHKEGTAHIYDTNTVLLQNDCNPEPDDWWVIKCEVAVKLKRR